MVVKMKENNGDEFRCGNRPIATDNYWIKFN